MSAKASYEGPQDDYAVEPVPGLPAALPEGERLIWQGSPAWRSLAIHAFHVRKVAIYFALLFTWRGVSARLDGASLYDTLSYAVGIVPMGVAAICILSLMAYGYARTTIYSLTSKRVLIRSGVAMPITVNIPFKRIDGAGLRLHQDGTGDLPLTLTPDDRIAILAIWPNIRPWRLSRPEPMLRSIPHAEGVADQIAAALTGARIPALRLEPKAAPQAAPDLRPAT